MGTWFAEGHSNAAGIYDAGASDLAVELHVGVAADDYCCDEFFEEREETVIGGQASKDVVFVLGRGVTEEDGAESSDLKGYCFWSGG